MPIELLNIDCKEYMASLPDNAFNLAICDPPYGINMGKSNSGAGWITRKDKEWDKEIPDSEYFKELFRVSKNQIIWGGNYFTHELPPSMGWIFWDKGQRDFSLADGELAFTSFDRALRVFSYSRGKANQDYFKKHPTKKPIDLYKWLLKNYAKPNDKILDTHGGSMSIAIACHQMGFDLTLCEIDKDYYDSGVKRYNEAKKQQRLFDYEKPEEDSPAGSLF